MTDLEKVKQGVHAIQNIKNPSLEIQLAAVRQDGYAICHIKNPSMEIQLIAALSKDYND